MLQIEKMMSKLDQLLEESDNGKAFTLKELMDTKIFESEEEIEVFFIRIQGFSSSIYITEKWLENKFKELEEVL
jgi:hypothetical protein